MNQIFRENLWWLRTEAGYHTLDLAQRLGIHQAEYQIKESGRAPFTVGELVSLAQLYETTLDDIVLVDLKENGFEVKPKDNPRFFDPDDVEATLPD